MPRDYREYDEMDQRRRKRAARKQQEMLRQRQLRLRLILACAVFLACVLLIVLVTRDKPGETGDSTAPVVQTQPPTEERATRPPDTPTTTIHIKAAGDLNVTDKVVAAGETNFGAEYYDFTKAFLDVAPLLANADLTVMNFEGNLVGPPYGTESASAPQQLVEALNDMGVDILQMANSFSTYNGIIGLNQTLNNIRAAGIEPVGAYSSPEEFRKAKGYTICEIQGIKVAVVAFTKGMGGLGLPEGSEDLVNKLYVDYDSEYKDVDEDGIKSILRAAASEKPDITIAMLHWGAEYNDTIFKTQKEIVQLMTKEGVDIILGTHSHMVHEVVFDKEENTLVAYSLGDFFGDATKGGTMYSIILDIQITKDNDLGTTRIDGYTVTPIFILSEEQSHGQRRVVRIDEAVAAYEVNFVDKVTEGALESMNHSLDRIKERVNPTEPTEDE